MKLGNTRKCKQQEQQHEEEKVSRKKMELCKGLVEAIFTGL